MGDVLNQDDIDALLNAVSDGEIEEEPLEAAIFSRQRRDFDTIEIKEYDFKRPERISKDQMRALQTLHDTFLARRPPDLPSSQKRVRVNNGR